MKLSFLFGSDLPTQLRLLREHKVKITLGNFTDIFSHLFSGVLMSVLSIPDKMKSVPEASPDEIVFVMGHYRSGTTHLLNLLAADKTLTTPNTFQVIFPHIFLTFEKYFAPLFDLVTPGVRAMDNMAMKANSPQEEEMALAAMGAPTPYLVAHFPQSGDKYRKFLSLNEVSKEEKNLFISYYKKFINKLLYKGGSKTKLLLKSPANTARVKLILEMYPNAKFINIHRDPYKTIQSSIHLYNTWYEMVAFQSIDTLKENLEDDVFKTFKEINERWIEDRELIKKENLYEVNFDNLKSSPLETIKGVYDYLNLGKLNTDEFNNYLASISNYKQNSYKPISSKLIKRINDELGFFFDAFSYEKRDQ